jgi:hypothetical protein
LLLLFQFFGISIRRLARGGAANFRV